MKLTKAEYERLKKISEACEHHRSIVKWDGEMIPVGGSRGWYDAIIVRGTCRCGLRVHERYSWSATPGAREGEGGE
jgi:hypothetical protein